MLQDTAQDALMKKESLKFSDIKDIPGIFNVETDKKTNIRLLKREFNKALKDFTDSRKKEGTKIKAMLDGTATMVEPDLFYTGGTLIFDHGHGISTLYMHMKDIYVKKGQKVKQGEIIGTVGSTGRSTGPHLDLSLIHI